MKEVMVWLDRVGDADTPEGATVVESETDFLRCALEEPRLLVRGERLCEWAGAFYRGRGLPAMETHSPIRALQRVIPGLTTEHARELLDYLGGERRITQEPGLTPRRVLETLYPEGPWSETPTRNHAAAWLRWLYLEQPTPAMQVTFAPLCEAWRNASIEPEHRLPACLLPSNCVISLTDARRTCCRTVLSSACAGRALPIRPKTSDSSRAAASVICVLALIASLLPTAS